MARTASKYPHVPPAKISSIDIVSFDAGLDQRGDANIKPNAFSFGQNVMVDYQGLATHRLVLRRWLPDTVEPAGAICAAYYGGKTVYVTADNGVMKYCHDGDSSWTTCGGDAVTTTGVTTTFQRIQSRIVILNGTDNLGYVDLSNMTVVHFAKIADPTSAPTSSLIGLTAGGYNLYYCLAYNTIVGKTIASPIVTVAVSAIREQWKSDGSQGITITDPNTRPTGAVSWNVYISEAPAGATIQLSDMIPLKQGMDIHATTFTDNGQLQQIINAGTAPSVNSTQGPKGKYSDIVNGRLFVYGITDDPYAVMIGGDSPNSLDFSEGNGGYRLVLNDGTDFFPGAIIGFRNGQGVPSTTVLYSSVTGLSKASIIDQNTVSLGTYSEVTWGSIDQNYGAAGVSSPYAVVDYRGKLVFPSTDGITNIDTSKLRFNVLTASRISDPVIDEVSGITTELLGGIVGTAWANRLMFAIPAEGYTYNNKILIYDVTREDDECWYVWDIKSQWIGTVSPPGSVGFVYVAQDNHFFKLEEGYTAEDEGADGLMVPFPVQLTTGVLGSNTAHNGYFAVVQAVLYARDFIGSADFTVSYRDYQSGLMQSRTKTFTNGAPVQSNVGNWSSPGELYNQELSTTVITWGATDVISNAQISTKQNLRLRFPMNNVITEELQATVLLNTAAPSGITVRSISFEGSPLGIAPDVR